MKIWIIVIAAVVIIGGAVTAWALLTPNPDVGDVTKLERTFTADEQRKLDTVQVSGEQLSAATCHSGATCWVAVNGVVYDMGGFKAWSRGRHHGVTAGADNTDRFVKSGHAKVILQQMPVIGRLAG